MGLTIKKIHFLHRSISATLDNSKKLMINKDPFCHGLHEGDANLGFWRIDISWKWVIYRWENILVNKNASVTNVHGAHGRISVLGERESETLATQIKAVFAFTPVMYHCHVTADQFIPEGWKKNKQENFWSGRCAGSWEIRQVIQTEKAWVQPASEE